jgi:CubicO group peptidase (beta-lactamase class C family)
MQQHRGAALMAMIVVGLGGAAGPSDAAPARTAPLEYADPASVGFSKPRLEQFDAAMQREVDQGRFAGITTLVLRHGKIVDFHAVGQQDLSTQSPMRKDSIFRIMSMTKPIVGVALMILYEEGRWQMDDPVSKFVPEFKDLKVLSPSGELEAARHEITMRELLTNTSGIVGTSVPVPGATRNPAAAKLYDGADLRGGTLADMIPRFAKLPLGFQPGTEFEYAMSQDVQGAVIERISGQKLDVFLQTRIFDPLGMADTSFGVPVAKRDRLAAVYDYDAAGKLGPSPYQTRDQRVGDTPKFLSGSGGLYSTAMDYARFATMLASGGHLGGVQILSPATIRLMTSDLLPPGVKLHFIEKLDGMGYGVNVGIIKDAGRAAYNAGGFGEGTYFWTGVLGSWWWNDPVNDITVIGMVQQEFAAFAHFGVPTAAPNLRAESASLIYGALTDPSR